MQRQLAGTAVPAALLTLRLRAAPPSALTAPRSPASRRRGRRSAGFRRRRTRRRSRGARRIDRRGGIRAACGNQHGDGDGGCSARAAGQHGRLLGRMDDPSRGDPRNAPEAASRPSPMRDSCVTRTKRPSASPDAEDRRDRHGGAAPEGDGHADAKLQDAWAEAYRRMAGIMRRAAQQVAAAPGCREFLQGCSGSG
jgi:hypothetical protein